MKEKAYPSRVWSEKYVKIFGSHCRFFASRTTVTKSTNAELIKDMENPLYKAKPAQPALSVPITIGLPPATLSLEGVSTAPPTNEAHRAFWGWKQAEDFDTRCYKYYGHYALFFSLTISDGSVLD